MVSIARHSYASRITESTIVLPRAQCQSLRGTMVVASGDGDGDSGGGSGDSDTRRRIAEVGKRDARSRIAEVGQCDARSRIAEVGRCDAMAACDGDEAGVCAVDNVAPIEPLQHSPVLGLRCGPNTGMSSPGSLERMEEVRGAWTAMANAPVSPYPPGLAGMVRERCHGREGSRTLGSWHARTRERCWS